jgi:hemolysin activation/secretion protein
MLRWLPAALGVVLASSAAAQEGIRPGDTRPPLPEFTAPEPSGARILPPLRIPEQPGTGALSGGRTVYVSQYRIQGASVLSGEQLAEITEPYLAREVSWAELEDLRDRITLAYVERGYVSSGAVIPDQEVVGGAVLIHVVEGTLARIDVETDGRYRPQRLESRLARDAKGPVNVPELEQGLQRLQRDERIDSVEARLVPSERRGESELEVKVHEAPPYQFGLDLSNYEVPSIGAYRARIDATYLNVLGFGDTVSTTYSVTEGLNEIEGFYEMPVNSLGTTLGAFTDQTWSEVVESPFDDLDIESRTWSAGLTLKHPLIDTESTRLDLFGTAELRYSKSSLLGSGFSFTEGPEDGEAKLTVFRFGQEWSYRRSRQVFVARSLVSWGTGLFDATTHSASGVPDGRFIAWLAQLQWAQRFEWLDALLIARLDGQLSNDPLLGLEQLGVGGPTSVRGYRENTMVRDQGVVGSIELRFPLLRRGDGRPWLEIGPFVDAGYASNHDRAGPTVGNQPNTLIGAGIAARVNLSPRTRFELTWGEALKNIPSFPEHDLQDSGIYLRFTTRLP